MLITAGETYEQAGNMGSRLSSEGRFESFGQALRWWRDHRELSLRQLAAAVHYSPGWISRIENGHVEPRLDLARACERVLEADGQLVAMLHDEERGAARIPRPFQLPPGAGALFVGREEELKWLDREFEGAAGSGTVMTVVIEGPPGVGKTALATRWGHQVRPRFDGGVLFADLKGLELAERRAEPGEVLERFLLALRVPAEAIPPDVESRSALLRSVADGQRILMVLDDAADSAQVEPLLLSTLGCVVVVTSRQRLVELSVREAAARLVLGAMSPEDSTALLTSAIGERASGHREEVRRLADRCGHLPLALRLAAERITAHPYMSVADMVAGLAPDAARLEVLAADEVAVRTALDQSYRALDTDEARMFRALGTLPGRRISLEPAAAVGGFSQARSYRLLSRLERRHLVERTSAGTWTMHDLLKTFAARQAEAEDTRQEREAAVARLVDWYVRTADAAHRVMAPHCGLTPRTTSGMPSAAEAHRWCDEYAETFLGVVELAARHRLPGAWELPTRLWAWAARHELHRGEKIYLVGLRAASEAGDRAAEGWMAVQLACLHARGGTADEHTRRLAERAIAAHREGGDEIGLAWSLVVHGYLTAHRGSTAAGSRMLRQAGRRLREAGDRLGQAAIHGYLGEIALRQGRLAEAEQHLAEAHALFERLRAHQGRAWTLLLRADAELQRGTRRGRVLDVLERALAARRAAGDTWGQAEVLERQGELAVLDQRPEAARPVWSQALALYEELGAPRAVAVRRRLASLDES